jgi:SPP1 family predicted phage head-tail adaptor
MPLQSGVMRRRVTIERPRENAVNAFGEAIVMSDQWTAWKTVWAAVDAITAREAVQADRTQTAITYKVRIRTEPELNTKHRLRWQGGILNIQSILLRGTRLEEQEILCAEEKD